MSQTYRVTIAPSAQKFIDKKAPHHMRSRLQAACEALAYDPRPHGCEKLSGKENQWRIRVGDYRIVYEIFDKDLWVDVVEADHRSNIYR